MVQVKCREEFNKLSKSILVDADSVSLVIMIGKINILTYGPLETEHWKRKLQ